MSWRDDVLKLTEKYDGTDHARVMDIFDGMWLDRENLHQLNIAYLQHIAELKSGKPVSMKVVKEVGQTKSLESSFRRLHDAFETWFKRVKP